MIFEGIDCANFSLLKDIYSFWESLIEEASRIKNSPIKGISDVTSISRNWIANPQIASTALTAIKVVNCVLYFILGTHIRLVNGSTQRIRSWIWPSSIIVI